MGDYARYRGRTMSASEEALHMHRYWEEKNLLFTMMCVDGDSRMETLIEKTENAAQYWLTKYNALTTVGE